MGPFARRRKYIKKRLTTGVDHFNRDPKKGLEFLQGTHLLPEKLDPQSVACFFRYTPGLDKNLVGDFLGNHDEFSVQVLHEFAGTFDFQDMSLDTALRLFLETFRLPGESQKIQRVLEAFSERYYEQSSHILVNKDAALLLSYSVILLNTDQHNVQVKKKMTEEDFIRNNRHINGGSDLPREFLSELYHSICKNEIRTFPGQGIGFPEMTLSLWVDLMCKAKRTSPYIVCDSRPFLDRDMFAIMSGPTIAAISVVFDHAEHEDVLQNCVDGFLAVAKISACHHLDDVLDDLVVSLCKFTTLLDPSAIEEAVFAFGEDEKARMATITVFAIANNYGNYIRSGWRNIVDCILRLHKIGLLPTFLNSDVTDDSELALEPGKPVHDFPLSASEVPSMECDSEILWANGQVQPALIFRDRRTQISTYRTRTSAGSHWGCRGDLKKRLLPYKESLADELLRSLQLVLKLDARVADAYCENITQEVMCLVKANATHIRSHMGWRTITSLLSITARHPEASEAGFEALVFIMSDGVHLSPANYVLCVDAARQFAESRVGQADRSLCALDLMEGSVACLARWSRETKEAVGEEAATKVSQDIGEMWLRLVQGLRKVCLDQREEIRNHSLLSLQRCLMGVDGVFLPHDLWLECFDLVIFSMLEELLEIAQGHSPKDYRNMERTLVLAMKLLSKVFLQSLPDLSQLTAFRKLWLGVLSHMEKYMKAKIRGKRTEKLQELIPELLKNTLFVLRTRGVLVQKSVLGGESLWESTWLHVNNIAPSLQSEVFPEQVSEQLQQEQRIIVGSPESDLEGIKT
ncbi:hypothetical protein IFM89_026615 [Coptis chinensis]|uniref:SEC7 domain-containing protein n=1 Tax=Coptis chinensis TaxID=261450 RepID=A0A835HFT0_9MAGN|nr:hypothetical protein IFM89_026615 [Coptis chinensis]